MASCSTPQTEEMEVIAECMTSAEEPMKNSLSNTVQLICRCHHGRGFFMARWHGWQTLYNTGGREFPNLTSDRMKLKVLLELQGNSPTP